MDSSHGRGVGTIRYSLPRNPLLQVWMEQPFGRQVRHRRAAAEGPREADERPLQQRRLARLVQRQQLTHLPMQTRIRERIGPQLVTEKALEDLLREDDRVQRHGAGKATALGVIGAYRTKHLTKLDVRPTIPSTQVERGARRT